MQIPGGLLADRFGGGKILLGSMAVVTIAPLIFVLGSNFSSALFSRAISGAACGIILPASVRLLSSWFFGKELNRAMGIFGSGLGISQTVSFVTLPLFMVNGNWQSPLLVTVAFSFVVTGMSIFPARWVTKGKTPTNTKALVNISELFTRNLFALTLTNFAALTVMIGVLAWVPVFLTSALGFPEVNADQVAALIGIAIIVGSFSGGYLAQRFGRKNIIAISMTLSVVFPILLGSSNSWWVAILWVCAIGWATRLYLAPLLSLVPYSSKQGPESAGITFGFVNTFGNLGTFASPLLFGYVVDWTRNFGLGFVAIGIVAISGVAGAIVLRMR
jgi:MFS family permease